MSLHVKNCTQLRHVTNQVGLCDRGYRGKSTIGDTHILIPKTTRKNARQEQLFLARYRFRRRAGIAPVIGHLKSDYRLGRNFLKGMMGDQLNVLIAAAVWNFTKWMRDFACILGAVNGHYATKIMALFANYVAILSHRVP